MSVTVCCTTRSGYARPDLCWYCVDGCRCVAGNRGYPQRSDVGVCDCPAPTRMAGRLPVLHSPSLKMLNDLRNQALHMQTRAESWIVKGEKGDGDRGHAG